MISNLRFIIDSLVKYGFLVRLPFWNTGNNSNVNNGPVWDNPQVFSTLASFMGSILISFFIEKLAAKGFISERFTLWLNGTMVVANLLLPILWVLWTHSNPVICILYLAEAVIIWMKLISYAHVNSDLRKLIRLQRHLDKQPQPVILGGKSSGSNHTRSSSNAGMSRVLTNGSFSAGNLESLQHDDNAKPIGLFNELKDLEPPFLMYPQNITLKNLLYFLVVPTLCYQLNYPRSPKIRINYILTLLVRMFLVSGLIIFAVEQHINPTLQNSLRAMENMDPLQIAGRLLKLSVPNTYVWLLGFYWFFHLWLNLLAELTRFGDRLFYKDW